MPNIAMKQRLAAIQTQYVRIAAFGHRAFTFRTEDFLPKFSFLNERHLADVQPELSFVAPCLEITLQKSVCVFSRFELVLYFLNVLSDWLFGVSDTQVVIRR